MGKTYKTVRLAYEAKVWINELISKRNEELQAAIRDDITIELEEELFDRHKDLLNGVSVNVVLKVTNGSVIEQAVRETKEYSLQKWQEISRKMEKEIKEIKDTPVDEVTPRLYLNTDILEELENLRIKLKPNGQGLPRLSYVMKLAVFALYDKKI